MLLIPAVGCETTRLEDIVSVVLTVGSSEFVVGFVKKDDCAAFPLGIISPVAVSVWSISNFSCFPHSSMISSSRLLLLAFSPNRDELPRLLAEFFNRSDESLNSELKV